MWDWLLALAEEYQIVKKYGWGIAVVAYFLARITTGILCVLSLIFYLPGKLRICPRNPICPHLSDISSIPTVHLSCATTLTVMGVMITIGSAVKAYLFLLRLRAIYGNSRIVKLFAVVGWLAVVGARMTIAFMIHTSVSHALAQICSCPLQFGYLKLI